MKSTLFVLLALSGAAAAQTGSRSASDAAKAFSLDLPAASAPAAEETPRLPPANPDAAPPSPSVVASFTLDTPIAQLIADPRAKAVLDKDMPGLSDDANLAKFQSYSLRRFQPLTGGQLSNALLAKTGADLAAIGGAVPDAYVPAAIAPTTRDKRLDSGR